MFTVRFASSCHRPYALHAAGEESLDAFRAYAAKAGRGLDRCQLCSRPGALPDYSAEAAGEPPADGESETLRPYAAARISFPDKSMTLGKGWVRCAAAYCLSAVP